jgi:hypothetical protein
MSTPHSFPNPNPKVSGSVGGGGDALSLSQRMVERAEKKLYLDAMVSRGSTAEAEAREKQADDKGVENKELLGALMFGTDRLFSTDSGAMPTDEEVRACARVECTVHSSPGVDNERVVWSDLGVLEVVPEDRTLLVSPTVLTFGYIQVISRSKQLPLAPVSGV